LRNFTIGTHRVARDRIDLIRTWRVNADKDIKAFESLKFYMVEAFRFDWSEEALVVGGICRRMQASRMKRCESQAFWLVAYPSKGQANSLAS